MVTEVRLPQWGMGMQEGCILRWLKDVGDTVEVGDELVEVEAAKVVAVIEAPVSGVLTSIDAQVGVVVPVRSVVGHISEDAGEAAPVGMASPASDPDHDSVSIAVPARRSSSGSNSRVASPRARRLAAQSGVDVKAVRGTGPGGRVIGADIAAHLETRAWRAQAGSSEASSVRASPLAKALARQGGVDLELVTGTGPGGQVVADDVRRAGTGPIGQSHEKEVALSTDDAPGGVTKTPVTAMRSAIAGRMTSSLLESAQYSMGAEASATHAKRLLDELNESWAAEETRLTWVDLIAVAVCRAVECHPALNSEWHGDEIVSHRDVDLGMAVALDEGLVVPVLRGANRLGLRKLSHERARLVAAARAGELRADSYTGSTITISVLGRGVVTWFTPVINPGEAAILGVGSLRSGVRWEGEQPVPDLILPLSLTVDHRIVDGRPASDFLATIVEFIEHPIRLLS